MMKDSVCEDDDHENRHTNSTMGAQPDSITSPESEDYSDTSPQQLARERYTLAERLAQVVASSPHTSFWVSFGSVLILAALSIALGNLQINTNLVGWPSRGTVVADRQSQFLLLDRNRNDLAQNSSDCLWEDLTTHVQLGWETYSAGAANEIREAERGCRIPEGRRRSLLGGDGPTEWPVEAQLRRKEQEAMVQDPNRFPGNSVPRKNLTTLLSQCYVDVYTNQDLIAHERLWPVWKLKSRDPEASVLDPPNLQELCQAEENTQRILQDHGLCNGCQDGDCLPPLSPVLYARLTVPNGFEKECDELAQAWAPHQKETERDWKECVDYIEDVGPLQWVNNRGPCPQFFSPSMVDANFPKSGKVKLTGSIFVTPVGNAKNLYDLSGQFDRGGDRLEGAYDTPLYSFLQFYANDLILRDVALAAGGAFATTVAMLVHTRSLFLTLVGVMEISLSFPLAFGVYRFLGGLEFFSFMNLVGLFVAFALGADNVFVAVDKWKNTRREMPNATTEEIAIRALPGAARAMLLPTITTTAAFLGSATCPVMPIRHFAIFCGLVVFIDYIVDVLVMFPCLCIYDKYRHTPNYFFDWRSRKSEEIEGGMEGESIDDILLSVDSIMEELVEDSTTGEWCLTTSASQRTPSFAFSPPSDVVKPNLIQRILESYYCILHTYRWPVLVLSIAAIAVCCYGATNFKAPDSVTNIQLLAGGVQYEKAKTWRMESLVHVLLLRAGGTAHVSWGLTPADTGDRNNPLSFTSLALDDKFDPSTEEAQIYMRDFCDKWYGQDFAEVTSLDYVCPIKKFDDWLELQASLPLETQEAIYIDNCREASGMPTPEDAFHPCLSSWAHQVNDKDILSWNGTVKVITIPYSSRVRIDSDSKDIANEWHLVEAWLQAEQSNAPAGVSNAYFSSLDYWWWDTSNNVYQSAISSGIMAISLTAAVILFSSRSLTLTFFSTISVVYVLASVTAMMSAVGWTLGFLESICFTILIGLSGDFVVHFSHAYAELPGNTDRHTRTKHALIHLGPSVLAGAFTTVACAFFMLFCILHFFRIFALVLVFTIAQSLIGSFVVFLVMMDCLGPTNPSYLVNKLQSCYDVDKAEEKCKKGTPEEERKQSKKVQKESHANFKEREEQYLDRQEGGKQEHEALVESQKLEEILC